MSEPQLERSVLEAKEREELFAIAGALGTRPGSRARKSDLISQILRATGIEEVPVEPAEKPKRTRARKVATSVDASDDAETNDRESQSPPSNGQLVLSTATPAANVQDTASHDVVSATSTMRPGNAGAIGNGQVESVGDVQTSHGAESRTGPQIEERGTHAGDEVSNDGRRQVPSHFGEDLHGEDLHYEDLHGEDLHGEDLHGEDLHGEDVTGAGAGAGEQPGEERRRDVRDSDRQVGGDRQRTDRQPGNDQQGGDDRGSNGRVGNANGPDGQQAGSVSRQMQGDGSSNDPRQGRDQESRQGRLDAESGNRRNRRRRGRERVDRPDTIAPAQPQDASFVGEPVTVQGFLDLRDEGYGFLRAEGFLPSGSDVYVSISQVRRFSLRRGDQIEGSARPATTTEKYPALLRVDGVNGLGAEEARHRPRFDDLTPVFPSERFPLETAGDAANMTARIVDLISPIAKGQRGLVVSPSKAGKTTMLKQIAHCIETNSPDVHLMVLLVDERPEEVTDMRRSVQGEVIASTFDRPADEHTQVAELTVERAKRLVEMGQDVVIVLDGITRLARAYNLAHPGTSRVTPGGIDTGALHPTKRFFGAARNIEEGGSLTILATASVETGSRMDEVIFEEFKGTANMELRLDRKLAESRLYPAIDVNASSTRHEELIFAASQLDQVWKLRRMLSDVGVEGGNAAGLKMLEGKISSTESNDQLLADL